MGLDFINISGILRNLEIQKPISLCFDNVETPILSCSYTRSSRVFFLITHQILRTNEGAVVVVIVW
jgi:hypothetical protein